MTQKYTTGFAKGQGMIPETVALLQVWQPGMTSPQLMAKAVEKGVLGRATAKRVRDMIREGFSPRYLHNGSRPAQHLKLLLEESIPLSKLSQLFLLHTARANLVLRDFVCETYWHKYAAGAHSLTKEDAMKFLTAAASIGKISPKWSEKMMSRVASYLMGCLVDFGMIAKNRAKLHELLPFNVTSFTTNYLAYEIHFSGMNDNVILTHPDWKIFGLEETDVFGELQKAAPDGHFIPQCAGDLLRISWKHKTMEEFLHALAE